MRNRMILSLLTLTGSSSFLFVNAQQPNILFIVAEDASQDLGCYGNAHVTTPNLDLLASQGARFRNAYTTYSVSSPSRGSIFTGLYAHQNGQIGLATHKYEMFPGIKTLPMYMKEVGYRTGCLGKIHVNPEERISFDYWDIRSSNFAKKELWKYAEKAEEFINSSNDPFLLMVNFPDSHFPVQPLVEGRPLEVIGMDEVKESLSFVGVDSDYMRQNTANYYNCINRLDESVGMLLKALERTGKAENTIIIFISDHGAQFSRGKHSNYEGGLKIPFIIKWPELVPPGEVRDEMISVIDLLPTFIHIAGGEIPRKLPGENLFNLWEDKEHSWRQYLFAGGMGAFPQVHFPRRSVRDERYKLVMNVNHGKENPHFDMYSNRIGHFSAGTTEEEIQNASTKVKQGYRVWRFPPQYELYDLQEDPDEWHNLADNPLYAEKLKQLVTVLHDWRKETDDRIMDPARLELINREMEETYKNKSTNDYQKNKEFKYRYLEYLAPTHKPE